MPVGFKCDISPSTRRIIDRGVNMQCEAAKYRYSDRDKYRDILNRLYQEETQRRLENAARIENDRGTKLEAVQDHISQREHIVDTIVDWVFLPEPRNAPLGILTTIPMIPFYRQIDLIESFYNHYLDGEPLLIEKSREEGVSFICCLIGKHEWRWTYGFRGGYGSNLLTSVDDKDNPKSLFEKIRWVMNSMPSWWMPKDFRWKHHSKTGHLKNPEMDSTLIGEGGDQIGRSDRTAFYVVDEKAFVEHQQIVERNLSQTTNCQVDVSSANGTNEFYEKRMSGRVDVFTFSYKDDPRKTGDWVEHERKRLDKVTFNQEVEINYLSSVEGINIEPKWVDAAIDFKIKPQGIKWSGVDVGGGGKDPSVIVHRMGSVLTFIEEYDINNGTQLTHKAIGIGNKDKIDGLHYDQNAIGHAVKSAHESTEAQINFKTYGIFGQGSCSDDYYDEFERDAKQAFLNCRAEIHYLLARRFEKTWEHVNGIQKYSDDEMISLALVPKDKVYRLKAELCSPKRTRTTSGKVKIESKEEMHDRGIKSPNMNDAACYAFAPRDAGHKHIVDEFDPGAFEMKWDPKDRPTGLHYGAVCIKENLSVHCMCAVWHLQQGQLYIYDEVHRHKINPETVCKELIEKMHLKTFEVDKIFGNEEMFKKERRSMARVLNKELAKVINFDEFQTVKIRQANRYDPAGSVMFLSQLNIQKRVTVHGRCKESLRQLANWRLEKGKVKQTGMQEALLLILSEVKRQVDVKEIMKFREYKTIVDGKPEGPKKAVPDSKWTKA